jgi:uncharacterized protein YjeT (DUF2065 family)
MNASKRQLRILGIALLLIGIVLMLANVSTFYDESKLPWMVAGFTLSALGIVILFLTKLERKEAERRLRSMASAGLS